MNMSESAVLHEIVDGLDPLLVRLMRVAVRALEEENVSLARAFAQGSYHFDTFYGPASQGLAYWVTEPHLVYEIYKAWVPLVRVRWEAPIYPGTQKRADLAVYRDDAGLVPQCAFEAKWWNRSDQKVLGALASDIGKLATCQLNAERLFLMTFWWAAGTDAARMEARDDIEQLCSDHRQVRLRFRGAFPTDWSSGQMTRSAEFTMALLEIEKPA